MKLGWKKLMPITIIFLLLSVFVIFYIRTHIIFMDVLLYQLLLLIFQSVCGYFFFSQLYLMLELFFKIKYKSKLFYTFDLYVMNCYKYGGWFYVFFPLEKERTINMDIYYDIDITSYRNKITTEF